MVVYTGCTKILTTYYFIKSRFIKKKKKLLVRMHPFTPISEFVLSPTPEVKIITFHYDLVTQFFNIF